MCDVITIYCSVPKNNCTPLPSTLCTAYNSRLIVTISKRCALYRLSAESRRRALKCDNAPCRYRYSLSAIHPDRHYWHVALETTRYCGFTMNHTPSDITWPGVMTSFVLSLSFIGQVELTFTCSWGTTNKMQMSILEGWEDKVRSYINYFPTKEFLCNICLVRTSLKIYTECWMDNK